MKLKLISDLHYNLLTDNGKQHASDLNNDKYDVLVVAGDLSDNKNYKTHIDILAKTVTKPIVIVAGNHDLWESDSYESGIEHIKNCCSIHSNVHFLENDSITIGNQKFIGCTLWFDFQPTNYDRKWSDIRNCQWLNDNVKRINQESIVYLNENISREDIVMTHHLPTQKSIHYSYAGDSCNKFFVSNMDYMIKEKQPKYWFHGHTHTGCNHMIDETNVVCNPLGYYFEPKGRTQNGIIIDVSN